MGQGRRTGGRAGHELAAAYPRLANVLAHCVFSLLLTRSLSFAIRDPADPFPATLPPAQEMLEAANPNLTYRLLDDKPKDQVSPNAHYFDDRENEVFGLLMEWMQQHGFVT